MTIFGRSTNDSTMASISGGRALSPKQRDRLDKLVTTLQTHADVDVSSLNFGGNGAVKIGGVSHDLLRTTIAHTCDDPLTQTELDDAVSATIVPRLASWDSVRITRDGNVCPPEAFGPALETWRKSRPSSIAAAQRLSKS